MSTVDKKNHSQSNDVDTFSILDMEVGVDDGDGCETAEEEVEVPAPKQSLGRTLIKGAVHLLPLAIVFALDGKKKKR